MSKTKKTESKFTTWLKNLQEKRRVVVLDEDSFEEKRNFTTSKFSLLVFFLFSVTPCASWHVVIVSKYDLWMIPSAKEKQATQKLCDLQTQNAPFLKIN